MPSLPFLGIWVGFNLEHGQGWQIGLFNYNWDLGSADSTTCWTILGLLFISLSFFLWGGHEEFFFYDDWVWREDASDESAFEGKLFWFGYNLSILLNYSWSDGNLARLFSMVYAWPRRVGYQGILFMGHGYLMGANETAFDVMGSKDNCLWRFRSFRKNKKTSGLLW